MPTKTIAKLTESRFHYENRLMNDGYFYIAGGDEVGRGCLAGPVVAAFCVLHPLKLNPEINDSKKIRLIKREELYEWITENAVDYGIGLSSAEEVDKHNIVGATKLAFYRAYRAMKEPPDALIMDAITLSEINVPQISLIRGDSRSLSVGAASILAKVTRDRLMKDIHHEYPEYGFNTNVGYGTKKHLNALRTYGAIPLHRFSFAPVAATFPK